MHQVCHGALTLSVPEQHVGRPWIHFFSSHGLPPQCCKRQMYRNKAPACQGTGRQHLIIRSSFTQRDGDSIDQNLCLESHEVRGRRCRTVRLPKPLPASLCLLCWRGIQKCLEMFSECKTRFSLTSVGDSCHDTDTGSWASHSLC